MTRASLVLRLRRRVRQAGQTQQTVARDLGISAAYLSDVLSGRREPGQKLLTALGLVRVVQYRRV